MASSSGTTSSNKMIEDHVTLFVAYDGKWEFDGKEWLFKESKGSMIVVSKYVTLSQITHKLCEKFEVQDNYGLKLEFCYRVGFPIIEIECDEDLSLFMSKSSKTELLLCVTVVVPKDDVAGGVEEDELNQEIEEDEINPDIKEESPHGRKDDREESRLMKAIREGNWVKAREIVNTKEVTWTSKLDDHGFTALHCAVGAYKDNEVLREMLMGINNELIVTAVNNYGQNPAHTAAFYGNTEALKMMFDSNPKCLFISDYYDFIAIHYAIWGSEIKTFLYMFKQMKSYKDEFDMLFRGMSGVNLFHQVIDAGLVDVAYELVIDFPILATIMNDIGNTALRCIIIKPDLFYSGTSYSFYSRFVYQNVPTENNSFGSTDIVDVENQVTPKKDKFVTKHMRRHLHDVISRICVKLWEKTLLHGKHKLPSN